MPDTHRFAEHCSITFSNDPEPSFVLVYGEKSLTLTVGVSGDFDITVHRADGRLGQVCLGGAKFR